MLIERIDEVIEPSTSCPPRMGSSTPKPHVAVRLYASDGSIRHAAVLSSGKSITIGRPAIGVDWGVDDAGIDRRHCQIQLIDGHVALESLDARHGCWLGDVRLEKALLAPGARVRLGRFVLGVEYTVARQVSRERPLDGMVGDAPAMQELAGRARRYARLDLPVLVRGPSGSGKELVAHALHRESGRSGRFVAVNAATLGGDLVESELFGHVRGAFTGARRERSGAFLEAHRGTLVIDEVAALRFDVQAKLLRVIEERAVRPVGADGLVPAEARLVTATSEPLELYVREGTFRRDLYERLAVCRLVVPSLRERCEDLPALCRHVLDGLGFATLHVSSDGIDALARLPLLGNVRELRGLLASAAVEAKRGCIDACALGEVIADRARLEPPTNPRRASDDELRRMLRHFDGNMARAARHAGVPRSTMRDRVRREGAVHTTPRPLLASELTHDACALERRGDDGQHPKLHHA